MPYQTATFLIMILSFLHTLLNVSGEVQFSKNGSTPVVFMHVDQTLQLWAFCDVYGSTQKIRILGSCVESHQPHSSSGLSLYTMQYMDQFCLVDTALLMSLFILCDCCDMPCDCWFPIPYRFIIVKLPRNCHILQKFKWKTGKLNTEVSNYFRIFGFSFQINTVIFTPIINVD
jgi:hypothetical protein